MPEQATSTVKGIVEPSGLVTIIVGLPYSLVSMEGMPIKFAMAFEASALTTARVAPIAKSISEGGGVKNIKKAIGKANWRRVCELNSMRIKPAKKIGMAKMWYSSGVKV